MGYKFNKEPRPARSRGVSKYQELFDQIDKLVKPGDEISVGFDTGDEARKAGLSIRRYIDSKYPKKTFSVSVREDVSNVWVTRRQPPPIKKKAPAKKK